MHYDYHNTTQTTGAELRQFTAAVQNQDAAVLLFFRRVGQPMSPRYVWVHGFDRSIELTSVRRAISNLTRDGLLVKTDVQLPGAKGRPEYLWRLPVGQMRLL